MATDTTARRALTRHGLSALKTRVKVRGLQAIDRRTAAARALLAWRKELVADVAGEAAALSAQQSGLIEVAVRTRLYVDTLDAWLMEQSSLVNGRKKAVLPVLRERTQLADSLIRVLALLGLERRAKVLPTLTDYLKAKTPEAKHDDPRRLG